MRDLPIFWRNPNRKRNNFTKPFDSLAVFSGMGILLWLRDQTVRTEHAYPGATLLFQSLPGKLFTLLMGERPNLCLDSGDRRDADAQFIHPQPDQYRDSLGIAGHTAANADSPAICAGCGD